MRLLYWRHPSWNFGDELNPWLWERVLPFRFDLDVDSWLFLGIGTILQMPMMHPRVAVLGSGLGYGTTSPEWMAHARRHWRFYAVRGPLTASRLGIETRFAITDPAVLVPRYFQPAPAAAATAEERAARRVAVVPHWVTASAPAQKETFRSAADALGYRLVDPRQSVDTVVGALADASLVLAESLHAAIVADAFRVPWIPLVTKHNQDTSIFKWQDWCASMEVPYEPLTVDLTTGPTAIGEALALAGAGFLSREDVLSARTDALDRAIARFVDDCAAGIYD